MLRSTMRRALLEANSASTRIASSRYAKSTLRYRSHESTSKPLINPTSNHGQSRTLETSTANSNSSTSDPIKRPPKHRPASTKRRQALASSSLRQNRSPTRTSESPLIAYSTAEKYDLGALVRILKSKAIRWAVAPEGGMYKSDMAIVIPNWEENGFSADGMEMEDSILASAMEANQQDPNVTSSSTLSPYLTPSPTNNHTGYEHPSPSSPSGEIWIFKNGSFVTWGLNSSQGKAFLNDVIRSTGEVEQGKYEVAQTEEVEFVVDPTE